MTNFDKTTLQELELHYEYLMNLWSMFSCDCLGFELLEFQIKIRELKFPNS